jgi:hypothetical protein
VVGEVIMKITAKDNKIVVKNEDVVATFDCSTLTVSNLDILIAMLQDLKLDLQKEGIKNG